MRCMYSKKETFSFFPSSLQLFSHSVDMHCVPNMFLITVLGSGDTVMRKRPGICPPRAFCLENKPDITQPILLMIHITHCEVTAMVDGYLVLSGCVAGGLCKRNEQGCSQAILWQTGVFQGFTLTPLPYTIIIWSGLVVLAHALAPL